MALSLSPFPRSLKDDAMAARAGLLLAVLFVVSNAAFAQEKAAKTAAADPDAAAVEAVKAQSKQLVEAFNAGKVDQLAAQFLPKGELIDEAGTVHQGHAEIAGLLKKFFEKFPETKLTLNVETVRIVGPVAIEEGTRVMKSGEATSSFRYISVRTKTDAGWKIASMRDFSDEPAPTPNSSLQSVAWLVGDWVNEGTDGKVAISYRWTEDKNFIVGEFKMDVPGIGTRTSTQRIGWDASNGRIRSWLFDADGGFAEGQWTVLEDRIVIQSASVNSDGTTANATLTLTKENANRFSFAGTNRIVGGALEPDFELAIVRRPPTAKK